MSSRAMVHVVLLAIVALLMHHVAAVPSCDTITSELAPCLNYITNFTTTPSCQCCQGIRQLAVELLNSPIEVTGVCQCINTALTNVRGIDPQRVSELPPACGIPVFRLPTIHPNFNCSSIITGPIGCVMTRDFPRRLP